MSNQKESNDKIIFKFPPLCEWWNDKFIPIVNSNDRYIILIGGRGSGKSFAVANLIVIKMLKDAFFKGLAVRKNAKDTRISCHAEIISAIKRMKLQTYFEFSQNATGVLLIKCKLNNNIMMFGGMNDVEQIKSTSNLSFLWIEEKVPDTLQEFQIINRSLRTTNAKIQTIFSINPTLDGDPTKHWFYKHFKYDVNDTLNFIETTRGEINGEECDISIRSIHSSFLDNRFLPNSFKIDLMNEKDEYLYQVDVLGKFARRQQNNRFYKNFNITKNIRNNEYNPDKPLFISFDFNIKPFLSLLIAQLYDNELFIIDEMAFKNPNNYTKKATQLFIQKYYVHIDKIYVTGDASGKQRDTSQEFGYDNYTIIFDELKKVYNPTKIIDRTTKSNASVSLRGSFINTIFNDGVSNFKIYINQKCEHLINDMLNGGEQEDGNKLKTHITDNQGERYEKHHHMSDAFDYLVVNNFQEKYDNFKNPNGTNIVVAKNKIVNRHNY